VHTSEGKIGLPRLNKSELPEMTDEEFEDYKKQNGVDQ